LATPGIQPPPRKLLLLLLLSRLPQLCSPVSPVLLLLLYMLMACRAVASGRATKLSDAQNRLPTAWLKLPHWCGRDAAGNFGLNFATSSCKAFAGI
jgi:hypothetical protein